MHCLTARFAALMAAPSIWRCLWARPGSFKSRRILDTLFLGRWDAAFIFENYAVGRPVNGRGLYAGAIGSFNNTDPANCRSRRRFRVHKAPAATISAHITLAAFRNGRTPGFPI